MRHRPRPDRVPQGTVNRTGGGALSELEKHPFLTFTGEVVDFAGGHNATVTIGISDTGMMYGTAKVGDAKLKLLSVNGKYFVNADTAFWKSYDHDEEQAKVLGGDWSPVDPKEFFDPGSVLATNPPGRRPCHLQSGKKRTHRGPGPRTRLTRRETGQSESCTATVTVKVGGSELADCSVTFSLRPGESQSVSAQYQSTGLMTFTPDTGDLGKQVKKGIQKLLDKL